MTAGRIHDPLLPGSLLERILDRLGFADRPALDLAGLNSLYAATSAKITNDCIQKRIWIAGDRRKPIAGGDPVDFFESWLAHGTGGPCFPLSGGLYALLRTLGFDARGIGGSVENGGDDIDGNHGSVVVKLEGIDYLVDPQMASFRALPLVPGESASTGDGLHDIRAEPVGDAFEISYFPGSGRHRPLVLRTDRRHDPVDHRYFQRQYALSVSSPRRDTSFNHALFICRRYPESLSIVHGMQRITVAADNTVTRTEIDDGERVRILIEAFGISEAAAHALPPDDEGFDAPRRRGRPPRARSVPAATIAAPNLAPPSSWRRGGCDPTGRSNEAE